MQWPIGILGRAYEAARARRMRLLVLVATTCTFAGCERSTHVRVEGGTTPVFILSGSGKLRSFVVYSPDFAEKAQSPWDENFALWKIKASSGPSNGTPVGELSRITYGVLPVGYTQEKPQGGSVPLLTEGQKYFYDVETTNAPGTAGYLEIRNSQAVSTEGPHPCFAGEGKKWVRVPCSR